MNRICTSVKQSRQLIKLGIDIDTADMHYMYDYHEITKETIGKQSDASIGFDSNFYYGTNNGEAFHYIPAWSLAALLNVLPHIQEFYPTLEKINNGYVCRYKGSGIWTNGTNSVDACVAMIIKLHELKIL